MSKKLPKKLKKWKRALFFNSLNRIYFKFLSCSEICDQNLAQNYFSSFLFLFDTKSKNRNLSKLFYALVATGLEFDYFENFVQIVHNLYPQSYIFDTYEQICHIYVLNCFFSQLILNISAFSEHIVLNPLILSYLRDV